MSEIEQFILNKLEKLDEKLDEVREQNAGMKAAFDCHTQRDEEIHKEVVKLGDSIDKHSDLLSQYNQQLEVHIKRTDLLESTVLPIIKEQQDAEAISKWRTKQLKRMGKWLGIASAAAGLIYGIIQILTSLI